MQHMCHVTSRSCTPTGVSLLPTSCNWVVRLTLSSVWVVPTVSPVRAAVLGEPVGLVGARMEWWLGGGVPFGLTAENPRGTF